MAVGLGQGIELKEALFWMNVNLEVLAIDCHALRRMRKHMAGNPGWAANTAGDIKMLAIEVERVSKRLAHWENLVAKVRLGVR